MTTLIVIDTNAMFHGFVHSMENKSAIFSSILKPGVDEIQLIFAMDSKPYWRDVLLKREGINYKANRQAKPQSISLLEKVRKICENTLMEKRIPLMQAYTQKTVPGVRYSLGYEADDIASAIARYTKYNNLFDRVFFFTDDSDWLAFTELGHTWIGIASRQPRIRTAEITMQWLKYEAFEFHKTKERKAYTALHVNKPTDIWKFKSYFGDNTDNLKGDKSLGKVFFRPYIDLFEPLEGFDYLEDSLFIQTFDTCLSKVIKVVDASVFQEAVGNTRLFSSPVENIDYAAITSYSQYTIA
ncbi:hypothetical protein DAPPUDRAFT_119057 [Daphnia pulex]|uniref:Uncharacterized protein n=1 Tax=Daphnia pulex TaxID=6669 RepID=E9HXB3_DAPPU|nr:hypothetical protein DAPPUDRAFT_119057 [Daphnia pulex]|eukprot:EFX63616.1 hypothetical protein DAPPUDRAFT_119057 [Daphnia pulex]